MIKELQTVQDRETVGCSVLWGLQGRGHRCLWGGLKSTQESAGQTRKVRTCQAGGTAGAKRQGHIAAWQVQTIPDESGRGPQAGHVMNPRDSFRAGSDMVRLQF